MPVQRMHKILLSQTPHSLHLLAPQPPLISQSLLTTLIDKHQFNLYFKYIQTKLQDQMVYLSKIMRLALLFIVTIHCDMPSSRTFSLSIESSHYSIAQRRWQRKPFKLYAHLNAFYFVLDLQKTCS